MTYEGCVRAFHEKFDVRAPKRATWAEERVRELRWSLMLEELDETVEAFEKGPLAMAEVCDGLVDLLYVTYGTAVSYGMDAHPEIGLFNTNYVTIRYARSIGRSASSLPSPRFPSVEECQDISFRLRKGLEALVAPMSVEVPQEEHWGVLIKGIADLLFESFWTLALMNVRVEPLFAEVHRTNMAKEGTDNTRHDGKILKPPGWKPPDLERLLKEQGWGTQ